MGIKLSAVAVLVASALMAIPAVAKSGLGEIDLTPIFAGMEKDCGSSNPKFDAALGWLTTKNGKPPMVAKAAPELRAAIGVANITMKDMGDFWILKVAPPGAFYRGVRLAGIERWFGKENGISGISLIFAVGPLVVTKAIGTIAVTEHDPNAEFEATVPQLLVQKGSSRAILVCDFST